MIRPKLLLHSCCGPCSTHVVDKLIKDYELTVFFYNPNIISNSEYILRESEQKKFIRLYCEKTPYNIGYIEGDYSPKIYMDIIKGKEDQKEGGQRCFDCFSLRLDKTAELAAKNGFDLFCTTLTVSPHKNAAKINEISAVFSEKYGISFLAEDFKKKDGYKHSIELSKEYGLYRQSYCGCGFPIII